jgi:3-methyladenine DNA glycosylase AlkD
MTAATSAATSAQVTAAPAPAAAPATGSAAKGSAATIRARALVAERMPAAEALGRAAGEAAPEPAAAVEILHLGLAGLADPEYLAGQQRIAPGIRLVLGVRGPLLHAVSRGIRAATRRDRSAALLDLAGRMLDERPLEFHWLAFDLLGRSIGTDPERTWQLVRAESRAAADWITVDTLAHVAGRGILAEPYRWAELEQLVYSPSRWERRLVGSTVATIPFVDRTAGRTADVARHGLALVGELMGDAEPDVQKALSWALRNLAAVDLPATVAFLRSETALAAATADGHRAWVVRDTFAKLPGPVAAELGAGLAGIRKRAGAPSTSRASATAADFLGLGIGVPPAERPIVTRT